MKKKILALCLALFSVCTMSAGDGFYIGGGAAYQIVPLLDGTTNYSFAPAAEVGYNYGSFGIGITGSFSEDIMLSADVNSKFMLTEEFGVIFGCGYGAVHRTTKCHVEGCDYKVSGFIGWPHVNVGVEIPFSDNLGLRLVGVIGYSRDKYDDYGYSHNYGNYDFATHTYYGYDGWRFASQVRAVVVWSF